MVNQGQAFVAYFVELADAVKDGKAAANWITQDVLRIMNEQELADRKISRFAP